MRRLIAVVDMEAFHGDVLGETTLGGRFMLPLVCSPSLNRPAVEPVITLKRIREKKSLIADAAVMSVADVVVKDPANLTTLRC